MTNSNNPPSFNKQKFQEFFWWSAPISLFADFIAIWSLFNFKEQVSVTHPNNPGVTTYSEKVFGFISVTDAIAVTGIFTIFIIVSIAYLAYIGSKKSGDLWPYILGGFFSITLIWSYLRLWSGEHGWLWIFAAIVLIGVIFTIASFRLASISDNIRIGCALITALSVIIIIFLIAATGALKDFAAGPELALTVQPTNIILNRPTQLQGFHPTSIPITAIAAVMNNEPSGYISYQLISEGWFPTVNGLNAGDFDDATNEKSAWGSTENLKLFQEMGRITSFEKFYHHPQLCKSNNLRDAYVQIIFFQSPVGAKQFLDWASEGADVNLIYTVGNNAYVYDDNEAVVNDTCHIDYASTTFQRNNVIARARIRSVEGRVDKATLELISLQMALFIDEQLKSNAK